MPSPSLAIYKDSQFLEELYRRLSNHTIMIDLLSSTATYAQLKVKVAATGFAFETLAIPPSPSN